jgi:hypothetical protein
VDLRGGNQADPVDDIDLHVHGSDIAGDETDRDEEQPDQQPQESSSPQRSGVRKSSRRPKPRDYFAPLVTFIAALPATVETPAHFWQAINGAQSSE